MSAAERRVVVVTGASGFVGRHLVPRLARDRFRVIAVDRVAPREPVPGVEIRAADLSDAGALDAGGDFALVHLAWELRRDAAHAAEQAAHVERLKIILKRAGDFGMRSAVLMGSAEEYGRRAGVLRETDEPVGPLSAYGKAKADARAAAMKSAEATALDLVWLRPFIVYGPGQGGDMAIPYAIRQAKAGARAEFTDGMQERDFIYVDDVVEAIVSALTKDLSGRHVLNLGRGEGARLRDVLGEIGRRFGNEDHFIFGARPRREGEPEKQVADISKARQLLGWSPVVGWREGIGRACAGGAS